MNFSTILLIVIILVLLYLVIYYINKDTSTISSYIKSGTTQTTISPKSVMGTNGASSVNFSYSIWFNVDDWNYRYGEPKIIFGRSNSVPQGTPDTSSYVPTSNDNINAVSANASSALKNSGSANGSNMITEVTDLFNLVTSNYQPNNTSVTPISHSSPQSNKSISTSIVSPDFHTIEQYVSNIGPCPFVLLGPTKNNLYVCVECTGTSKPYIMEITNIPIQRWVNIFISVFGRTLDVYLDGKLVKTGIMPSIAKVNPNANIYLTPSGGFNGWTSKLQYWDNPSDPQKAWNIYKAGYGSGLFSNLFGKYQVEISILKDNQPTKSIVI